MCPPDDTIAALLEGRLPAREAAEVHAHAADCEICRQVIAEGARSRSAVFRPPKPRRPSGVEDRIQDATEAGLPPDDDEDAGNAYWDVKTQGPMPRGFSVGRYTVLEHLASGGMGSVYAAYDPDLDRRVALKVISTASRIAADDLRWRLLREAQAMASLNHPNVAVVHEVGTISGHVFLAMEYVEGGNLREWLNQKPRSWQEILRHFVQAGRGLAAAHARGLVHRDFKPDNVLLGEDGRARVVDFGLVRPREDGLGAGVRAPTLSTPLTEVGTLLGTPRYMAPEQMRGKPADGRCDQFAFCVSLYEALFRVRPFGGETLHERLQQIDRGAFNPPAPSHGVPERIGAAVRRGLNPEPARRFASMDELLAVLERVLQPTRGWRVALAAGSVGAAVVLGAGGWAVTQRLDPCNSGDARLRRAWGPSQRAALPATWAAGGQMLDAYAARWRMAFTQACEAPRGGGGKAPAGQDLATRLSCLDHALGELGGAAQALSRGDAGALARAGSLPEPAACLERPGSDTPSAANDARREDLLKRLSALAVRLEAGAAPVNELRALAEDSQPVPGTQARALVLLGRAEARAHPRDAFAEDAFHRAATAAQLARDDGAAARAWLELSGLYARSGRVAEARRWAAYAQGAASRSAGLADLAALARQATSDAALAEGKLPEAAAEHQAALALLRTRPQPEDAALATVLLQGVPLYARLGKTQEAVADAGAAARIRTSELHEHPLTAEALDMLAQAEMAAGKWAEAERDEAGAVTIFDKTLDPADLRPVRARARLGGLLARAGKHAQSVSMLGPAVGVLEREGLGVPPLELALAEQRLGREQLLAGDAAGAAATLERARNMLARTGPEGAAELPLTLAALGDARWSTGPKASSRELLEQARAALPAQGARPFDRAYASLLLARSLVGGPAGMERARALVAEGRAARAALDASTWADDLAALDGLDRWLKGHKL